MSEERRFYIDGVWVEPASRQYIEVIDPATERPFASVAMGDRADAERAVAAAKRAFPSFSQTTREERIALLKRVLAVYNK